MKLYIAADMKSNWIPKEMRETFEEHTSLDVVEEIKVADAVWLFSYYVPHYLSRRWAFLDPILQRLGIDFDQLRENKIIQTKFTLATFAHLYHPKEQLYIEKVKRADRLSDVIHFFSQANMDLNQHYFSKPLLHLPYWLDTTRFQSLTTQEKTATRDRFGVPQDKIVLGSFQRDTESDEITPKLEKGPDQFCDVIESLDRKRIFVLLAGHRRHYVERRLEQAGVAYKNLGFVSSDAMSKVYNALDYYLVTSRVEGGPQAILEAMATRTPIYTTRVGVSDMLDQRVVFDDIEQMISAFQTPYPDVLDTHYETIQRYSPQNLVPYYDQVFRHLWDGYKRNQLAEALNSLPKFS